MTSLPLAGKRILVTRAKAQSGRLQQKLEAAGADVVSIPAIEIVPPDSYEDLDAALRTIVAYDWLVLTSANAVHAIASRAHQIGIPLQTLSSVMLASIGSATADACTGLGLTVSLIPPQAVAESLAEALAPRVAGKRVLLVRAKVARDLLPAALREAGAHVTIVDAYQTIIPAFSIDALRTALQNPIDAVTFTSASSVTNLAALLARIDATVPANVTRHIGVTLPRDVKKISIGPITTQALIAQGWTADAEARKADIDALVEAVMHALAADTLKTK